MWRFVPESGGRLFSSTAACRIVWATLIICSAFSAAQSKLDNEKWIVFERSGAPTYKLQCFTSGNVEVANDQLVISTRVQTATCSSFDLPSATYKYTSGFVSMRSFTFLYGTVEFRAKFGGGNNTGAWPAVWMQDVSCQKSDPTGTNDDCRGQEIDIAEVLDGNFRQINQQIHIDNFSHNDGCKASVPDTSQHFHTYQLDWSPGLLLFKIDGTTTCTIRRNYVPSVPMYVKISMFVGGYGGPLKEGTLPWTTLVDYVKVTQGSKVVFEDNFKENAGTEPPREVPKRGKKKKPAGD
jgi:beta-glucanase (GH16 family)